MHNNIFQISSKKLNQDRWITEDSFEPATYNEFADYLHEVDRNECIKVFPLMEMFERNGDVLTYLGNGKTKEKWFDDILKYTPKSGQDINGENLYYLTKTVKRPFTNSLFVLTDYYDFPECSADFITSLDTFKPGDKFYICGVVGFHW